MPGHLVALDQGTTSTRAIVFDASLRRIAMAQRELPQIYPRPGEVEHDPEEIWATSVAVISEALARAGLGARDIASLGITNQRETALAWDRDTGKALCNAIVWQDRRTAGECRRLTGEGREPLVTQRTGLLLDPYFSGTKFAWMLAHVPAVREAARRGSLMLGTVDAFLVWRLTGGAVFATDATNASRTLLVDIRTGAYDPDLLDLFGLDARWLPDIRDCAGDFGRIRGDLFGAPVPIGGVAGDQQAATIGQACFEPGNAKVTYGTGAFALLNTGPEPVASSNRLLATIAYQLGGRRTYALEGAIFVAGAAVQWLRDGLGLIDAAGETEALARASDPDQAVYLVPAFVGLGAPWWDAQARGALYGLTRGTTRAEIARAVLESVAYQTFDLLEAMGRDWPKARGSTVLRVDGGMAASDWTMQCLADILDAPVDRPPLPETTAVGAAYLAGFSAGLCPPPDEFSRAWRSERRFTPAMAADVRERKLAGWRDALSRTLTR